MLFTLSSGKTLKVLSSVRKWFLTCWFWYLFIFKNRN